jgi:hypothetical protein
MDALSRRNCLNIEITVAEPIVFIPNDPCDLHSPLLVLDLGTFRFASLSADLQAKSGEMISSPNGSVFEPLTVSNAGISLSSEVEPYDNWILDVTSVHAVVAQSMQHWRRYLDHCGTSTRESVVDFGSSQVWDGVYHIIEKFDVLTRVQTCVLAQDDSVAKVRVQTKLPTLRMNLSAWAYSQVLHSQHKYTANIYISLHFIWA